MQSHNETSNLQGSVPARPISCWDLRDVPGKPGCCGSCHEDADEFGYWMHGDGENWDVCCAVSRWLHANGISVHQPAPPDHPIVKAALADRTLGNDSQLPRD